MFGRNKCKFCKKVLNAGDSGPVLMRSGDIEAFARATAEMEQRRSALKCTCPDCRAVFCLECGNAAGRNKGFGGVVMCPGCGALLTQRDFG